MTFYAEFKQWLTDAWVSVTAVFDDEPAPTTTSDSDKHQYTDPWNVL